MTKQEFDEMILAIVASGVEVKMFLHKGGVWYNMNTEMKSHLYITHDGGQCLFEGRYDKTGTIEDLNDLIFQVSCCDYGRGFRNAGWNTLLG